MRTIANHMDGSRDRAYIRSATPPDGALLQATMLAAIPSLRAFARSVCGNADRADDLVQDALLRALANLHRFEPGTNMAAWLITILRNCFRSQFRKGKTELAYLNELAFSGRRSTAPEQYGNLEYNEFRKALMQLPIDQREALVLVGASGLSHQDAAKICGCAVGTIKSRVHRARTRLAELMQLAGSGAFGPDGQLLASIA